MKRPEVLTCGHMQVVFAIQSQVDHLDHMCSHVAHTNHVQIDSTTLSTYAFLFKTVFSLPGRRIRINIFSADYLKSKQGCRDISPVITDYENHLK